MTQLEQKRFDLAVKQKRGLHFIVASVIIWLAIICIYSSAMPILTKNLFVFICTGILLPLAWVVSKILKINFSDNENPLSSLGILFSVNQLLYLLIAMWIYPTIPDKMLMVIAMIFGAHLMPFSWLYKSKVYLLFSIVIPFFALFIGLSFSPTILAIGMTIVEAVFCGALIIENKS
ncbi:hypothetical protein H5S09_07535 [Limosilactobacillus sp. STM2_1]|uniref:Uncharacterized protein n=1 Tax=Limosilactobacillus rudii TaxID=2759755 RepID=A0A7W3ULQ0_9LACO|nr:hypothetical protein [Limosilactobacillus rudii]MBB1079749.1 hypothetical protein [Limosilactobacillus rudii]MBB1097791.1 hypothetical protein [Limosilactobacillus rudii]MCD7134872.1 hypothetical protein [Limosilactobacillus rudii]